MSANEKNAKLGQKGPCGGHVTHFWNFGTTLISLERLKLENSNLTHTWMAVSTNEPPDISGTNEARNFKYGTEMDGQQ